MIDLETIEREINELEARGDTTYSLCERLSWLYTVRDHLIPKATQKVETAGSEFLNAINGLNYPDILKILDEHMSAIKAVFPNEYESVMAKIQSIK